MGNLKIRAWYSVEVGKKKSRKRKAAPQSTYNSTIASITLQKNGAIPAFSKLLG